MQLRVVQRLSGFLLALFSIAMLPPLAIAWFRNEPTLSVFLACFAGTLIAGLLLWFPVRAHRAELRLRDGFLVVVLMWTVLAIFGAVPFLYSPGLSPVDALFESMSGLTTTGATVLSGIDGLPESTLFYRQQLQWLGGMGIIVLAVAILPMLGIGGMQLYRAETPGPMKDTKLTPRITETAKALWYIYLGLTVACAGAYWSAGMSVFDAIAHSFSTVALGGFSTHDESFGYFDSGAIELVAVVFMVLSGANFALHFLAWRRTSPRPYLDDAEFRAYLTSLAVIVLVTISWLHVNNVFASLDATLHHGLFQAVSIATTAGFTTADYAGWPPFLTLMLLMASFVGACAGSTGGGLKVIRILLLIKQGLREVRRLIHPNAWFQVKVGGKSLSGDVIDAIWGFFSLYIACFCIMSLLLAASGLDMITAFSAVAASINNLGPGLGAVAVNYAGINDFAKWVLCFAMLLGRLEIFTLLVLFMPGFWKK
jgi:trk system potassium uptake protein